MFAVLNWTKEEHENIDIKARKLVSLSGSFHVNNDVDRLYCSRNVGGRGLNSIVDIYTSRIVSFVRHINEIADRNPYLKMVQEHEKDGNFRFSEELIKSHELAELEGETPKMVPARAKKCLKEVHEEYWLKMKQYGYLFSKRRDVGNIDVELRNAWHTNSKKKKSIRTI